MMDAHRGAFVAEAEDGITDLNDALLALEADPTDDGAMDDVFRVAHTLKGNAAAMGYEDVSSFGHALEDLLDAVRQGDSEVTPELMDLLFEGVDTVDAMIGEVADTGEVSTNPSDLESRLREMESNGSVGDDGESDEDGEDDVRNEGGDGDEDGDEESGEDGDGDEDGDEESGEDGYGDEDGDEESGEDGYGDGVIAIPERPAGAADFDPDATVYVQVTIGDTSMAGVDATFVIQAFESSFEEYATVQPESALEDGDYEEGFDAFVVAHDPDDIADRLAGLTQVEDVTVAPLGETGEPADTEQRPERVDDTDDGGEDGAEFDTDDAPPTNRKRSRDEITSIRVDVDQVDDLYGLVEQLVTSRIKLRRELMDAGVKSDALDELDKLASSLQDTAMDMRLIPFSQVSDSFPRLVRDLARDVDKQVTFEIEGDDVEFDRTILTEMRDPLVHVLRNAVDHGIEPAEERTAAGKDSTGTVRLTAERDRDHVVIEVSDDGGGLDADGLRDKAVAEGVEERDTVDAMDDEDVYDLVFHPGFSTAEEVTDVSGRGVGMDVVRTTARTLDGSVAIESVPGEGTTVRFRLPVTVAIVTVMFVDVDGVEYGIPIKSIAEVASATGIETVHGEEILRHEDDLYPVIRLADRLDIGRVDDAEPSMDPVGSENLEGPGTGTNPDAVVATDGGDGDDGDRGGHRASDDGDTGGGGSTDGGTHPNGGMIVRIREDTRHVALHCDDVVGQEEVVVKPFDGPLSGTPGLSGTAVLGDGDVVAVLDVVSL